jgi:hypothetical protein
VISLEFIPATKVLMELRHEPVVQIQQFLEHLMVVMVELLEDMEDRGKVAAAVLHQYSP